METITVKELIAFYNSFPLALQESRIRLDELAQIHFYPPRGANIQLWEKAVEEHEERIKRGAYQPESPEPDIMVLGPKGPGRA